MMQTKDLLMVIPRVLIPGSVRRWLWVQLHRDKNLPPLGRVRFGSFRRLKPISSNWGFDRGLPIDRYYIERFLSAHRGDIRGHVLEILNDTYTRKFGGDQVSQSDVLSMEFSPLTTIVGDLTHLDQVATNTFDCIILTQTLQLIYDVRAALSTVYRILKPGGTVLATFPGISQISLYDMERWGDHWRFTTRSASRMFEEVFPHARIQVDSCGNVLAATALLHGLAAQELHPDELDASDPGFQVLITIRAAKPEAV
jgi:SAM-dependent methyltransferase